MAKYDVSQIRNVCLLSHGGAGKTSLLEAMLFNSGATDRLGKVTDGTTMCDYDDEEIKRKVTINAKIAPVEWNGVKINMIDTPGYFDFAGEVAQGIRAADAAVIVVGGNDVAVGTENSFAIAKEKNIPIMFYVNKMDHPDSNYSDTVDVLKEKFGTSIAPFHYPLISGDKLCGFIDIITKTAYKSDGVKFTKTEFPADLESDIDSMRSILMDAVAETDEELMEKYFDGEEFTVDEIKKAVRHGVKAGDIVPVYCGSALHNIDVTGAMEAIVKYFPAPDEMPPEKGVSSKTDGTVEINADPKAPFSAICFKTIADPFVGKLTLFKVTSGTLKPDSTVLNSSKDANEKIGRLLFLRGKKQVETDQVVAGDIAAVAKLTVTSTGDTLCAVQNPVILDKIEFPAPCLSLAVVPKAKGDEEKIGSGLHKLGEEDPTFSVGTNHETHQMLVSGIGEQHLDVIMSKLKNKYGVSVELIQPRVPYRETIRKRVEVEGKHKKQSGGHGQYGHVKMIFEPGEEEGLTFEEKVFGGAVPKNYFPAVEKGLQECLGKGVLAGYPVVNLKATLIDGSYHPVDSSEMAFKLAASIAYKEGLKQASPVLLEPIGHLEVKIPESSMGDIIGDINKRRGRILGMNPIGGGLGEVVAEVPLSEMFKYATDLRSMTQGRGKFTLEFVRYEEAPANVAQKVIESSKAEN